MEEVRCQPHSIHLESKHREKHRKRPWFPSICVRALGAQGVPRANIIINRRSDACHVGRFRDVIAIVARPNQHIVCQMSSTGGTASLHVWLVFHFSNPSPSVKSQTCPRFNYNLQCPSFPVRLKQCAYSAWSWTSFLGNVCNILQCHLMPKSLPIVSILVPASCPYQNISLQMAMPRVEWLRETVSPGQWGNGPVEQCVPSCCSKWSVHILDTKPRATKCHPYPYKNIYRVVSFLPSLFQWQLIARNSLLHGMLGSNRRRHAKRHAWDFRAS